MNVFPEVTVVVTIKIRDHLRDNTLAFWYNLSIHFNHWNFLLLYILFQHFWDFLAMLKRTSALFLEFFSYLFVCFVFYAQAFPSSIRWIPHNHPVCLGIFLMSLGSSQSILLSTIMKNFDPFIS